MDTSELLTDAFGRIRELYVDIATDLTPEAAQQRPEPCRRASADSGQEPGRRVDDDDACRRHGRGTTAGQLALGCDAVCGGEGAVASWADDPGTRDRRVAGPWLLRWCAHRAVRLARSDMETSGFGANRSSSKAQKKLSSPQSRA